MRRKKLSKHYPKQELVLAAFAGDKGSPAYREAWRHYGDVLNRAYQHGRMATPERMTALYPILREIAEEVDTLI